ncbi:MAG: helix-turn-helix domain-containing protein, partial [Planctomycetes bacterium]|nr:helix-turn-helix domain-containing protein [Planctomycetota bacterium]
LVERMSPESRERIRRRTGQMHAEMALQELRQARRLTQQELADGLQMNQAATMASRHAPLTQGEGNRENAGDTERPKPIAFDMPSPIADVGTGRAEVELRVRLVGDLSGVAGASYHNPPTQVRFRSPTGHQSATAIFRAGKNLVAGTARDGRYHSTVEFPLFAETGSWRIEHFLLVDQCGNSNRLTADAMEALGFPTRIMVHL